MDQIREKAENSYQYKIYRNDVVQDSRDQQYEDTGNQSDEWLQRDNMNGHRFGSIYR
jgi:hypothetical protein